MSIDLSEVDYVILSHGHYDHIDGLPDFLNIKRKAKIIVSPHDLENEFFSLKKGFGSIHWKRIFDHAY
jgi:7,8-dihydropterin-6-yl-methyl-4-(beta-D-ribofuranosyl)aminobenzene 5'-phosphate synthase